MNIPTKERYIELHNQLIQEKGGSSGIRDEGLLDSALNTPFQTFGGEDLYQTLEQKAARLCYGIVKNHPFIDGNKRIGIHAMLMFLSDNDIELDYTQDELISITMKLASGDIGQKELKNWIMKHRKEINEKLIQYLV